MSQEKTYIIGHKNPDTDSICSAIGLAELKRAEGARNIEPARAGDINPQTAFILDYFKVSPPKYLSNVYPRARDVMTDDIVTVCECTPIAEVMETIRDANIRFVPVVDVEKRPKGILTLMELAKRNLLQMETEGSRAIFTSRASISRTLNAEVITDLGADEEKDYHLYVGAMEEDSFLKVLGKQPPDACIVIVGDRERIQQLSVERGVGLLIVTGGHEVEASIVAAARVNNVSILISPYDSATTAFLVSMSTPAYKVCEPTFETASPEELVDGLKHRVATSRDGGLAVLEGDGTITGIITKSNLLKPSGISLFLVDHNELSQAVDGAEMVKIEGVVDHHRLGNFHTTLPITFVCEPVGSTSTLVAEMYRRKGIEIDPAIAGLLLGGVMSDTIILRSPTTTERDRNIIPWLEEQTGLDHQTFGREMFAATSSIVKRGTRAVVNGDYKTFSAKGHSFGVGQVETIGFDEFHAEKERLSAELLKVKEEKNLKLSALLVTDIAVGTSLLLAEGEPEVLRNLDYPKIGKKVFELKNVLSRKKQVAPRLLSLFNDIF